MKFFIWYNLLRVCKKVPAARVRTLKKRAETPCFTAKTGISKQPQTLQCSHQVCNTGTDCTFETQARALQCGHWHYSSGTNIAKRTRHDSSDTEFGVAMRTLALQFRHKGCKTNTARRFRHRMGVAMRTLALQCKHEHCKTNTGTPIQTQTHVLQCGN